MMNYYIDFDNTLYNTRDLTNDMLKAIEIEIQKKKSIEPQKIKDEIKSMFNREHIYNIFKLIDYFADKYNLDGKLINKQINDLLLDGERYLFDDSIKFLKEIKEKNNIVNILTYDVSENLLYQCKKVTGSKLANYVDNIMIVSSPKYTLDLKYEQGIFYDDNPKDLQGLAQRNPKGLVRVRRKINKYSAQELEIDNMIECESLKYFKFD